MSNLQTSTFHLAPDLGVAVMVMANTKHGAGIGQKVLEWALDKFCDVGPRPRLPTVGFDPEDLVGTYDLGQYAWVLTAENGRLYIQMDLLADTSADVRDAFENPRRELVAVGEDVFASAESPVAPVLDVRRARDGSVQGIVHGLRFAPRVD